ncbi:MAG: DUF3800 domain-containing protein [Actinomycetota bacterium]
MATIFLDETGTIANDRIFAIGCLKLPEPARLMSELQLLRDRSHLYNEIKFADVTAGQFGQYKKFVDVVAAQRDARFFCFVADRDIADPIQRFGTPWDAYARLAEQLIVAVMQPNELAAVLADKYSTPKHVLFEESLRASVNRRFDRLAIVSVCRLDSKSCDGLQVVDLLTSATAFEFRQAAGAASSTSPKANLSMYVRTALGTASCLGGWRNATHSVAVYNHGSWSPPPPRRRNP